MRGLGITTLIIGFVMLLALINPKHNHSIYKIESLIAFCTTLVFLIGGYILYKRGTGKQNEKRNIIIQQKNENENKINQIEKEKFKERISRLESLKTRIDELIVIKVVDISDYKTLINENQYKILQKGNDDILFSFLKIDSFLNDYKQGMESCKDWMIKNINVDYLKSKLTEDYKRNDLDKLTENLQSNLNKLDEKKSTGFDANFDKLVSAGHVFKGTYENYNKTLEYYKSIAKTMVVFYLSDNKISYFEIHQAFEKLGAFDSTWQKNLMNKICNIETNLSKISDDLTQMNSNFEQLINQSEKITNELKSINSSVQTGNMIQVISAYQLWRINRKNHEG